MKKSALLSFVANHAAAIGFCMASTQAAFLTGCVAETGEVGETEELGAEESSAISATPASAAPVVDNGALQIVGKQLQNKNGVQVQLRGMSFFWSQWGGAFYNASVVNSLVDTWKVNVVRAAMGVESGGYLTNPAAEKARVKTIIDAAIAKGIYVIVDWHDHNAPQHVNESKAFFKEIAQTYAGKPNLIFEIFNEPDGESWTEIKSYATQVLTEIRNTGSQNVVVVGTPTWSQDVDQAANSPITGFTNVAYTLHFYAGTHKQSLRDKATYAMGKNIALFVTEFGTCDASGNGNLDLAESQTWINFLNTNKLSWANWSLFDKNETASALVPGASTSGNWPSASLTASGAWVKQRLLDADAAGGGSPVPPPASTFTFSVSPNVNAWWIQVNAKSPGHTVQSVTATVNASTYNLALQSYGDWTISPASAIPSGTKVVFTAKDDTNATATFTSNPWP